MAVIKSGKFWMLNNSIAALCTRMKSLHQVGFSHDEFLSLLAPKEHWPLLKGASEIAEVAENGGYKAVELRSKLFAEFGVDRTDFRFDINVIDGRAPLAPRNSVIRDDAPPELVERLTSWAIEHTRIGLEYGRAQRVLSWLSDHCDNLAQIRYCWPSLIPIAAHDENTKPLAEKLRALKAPTTLPNIPLEVRAACRQTSKAIAVVALLSENAEKIVAPVIAEMPRVDIRLTEGALGIIQPI